VDAVVVITSSCHDGGVVSIGFFQDDTERAILQLPAPADGEPFNRVFFKGDEMSDARLDRGVLHMTGGPSSSRSPFTRAEGKYVHVEEADLLRDRDGLHEVLFRFPGEPADDVSGQGRGKARVIGKFLIDLFDHLEIVIHRVLAIHLPEDRVGSRLQWEVQVGDDDRLVGNHCIEERLCHVTRFKRTETESDQTGYLGYGVKQISKGFGLWTRLLPSQCRFVSIGSEEYAGQHYFPMAQGDEATGFLDHDID